MENEKVLSNTIEVRFEQQSRFVGEILIHLKVGDNTHTLEASNAYPFVFEDLIKFLVNILIKKSPSSFRWNEEGVIKKLNAFPHEGQLFKFIIGNLGYDKFFEGVFDKKQFASEFYRKFLDFLSSGYIKERWLHPGGEAAERYDLKKIDLSNLNALLEKT